MVKRKLLACILPCFLAISGYGQRIQPEDLEYLGAFRLPDAPGMPDNVGWEWSNWSSGMTYFPGGDPAGPEDGHPGSLFGVGHDHTQYVSEVSIPVPVVSSTKDLNELNTAETIQPFTDIRGGMFGEMEMPRVGLEYLPAQGSQASGKLYFAWAPHLDEGATSPSHGWCELNLSASQPSGPWRIGEYWNYTTGDYLFEIPSLWADQHVPGLNLATGRYRDGGQGGQGPSLIAVGPWNAGNPPPSGSTIAATPLLLYGTVYEENPPSMTDYHHSDEWSGAAWLTAGDNAAVVFVGTKGLGDCWYGCADGTDQPPWPDTCNRGWWSDNFVGEMVFYDPADLAAVARGDMNPWEPQSYATMDIDPVLFHVESAQQWYHVGAVAFDRARGFLYVMEPLADEDKSVIHVWEVNPGSTGVGEGPGVRSFRLHPAYPNPFNPETTISYELNEASEVDLSVYNLTGKKVSGLVSGIQQAGLYSVSWRMDDQPSGTYLIRMQAGDFVVARKCVLMK